MLRRKAFVALAVAVLWASGAPFASASQHDRNGDQDTPTRSGTAGVSPAYHPEYFATPANSACSERFKTYDRVSGTYLGRDGHRHPCRVH